MSYLVLKVGLVAAIMLAIIFTLTGEGNGRSSVDGDDR